MIVAQINHLGYLRCNSCLEDFPWKESDQPTPVHNDSPHASEVCDCCNRVVLETDNPLCPWKLYTVRFGGRYVDVWAKDALDVLEELAARGTVVRGFYEVSRVLNVSPKMQRPEV